MRVVCEMKVPEYDSSGRQGTWSHVHPHRENAGDIKLAILSFIEPIAKFKPGMEIVIKLEEDWK